MKKILMSTLMVSMLVLGSISPVIAYATEVPNKTSDLIINDQNIQPMDLSIADGELRYYGGQTNKIVFSEIARTYKGERANHDYNVKAIVKVAGQKYTSGWKLNYAYIEKDRVWYGNETSHYDYEAQF